MCCTWLTIYISIRWSYTSIDVQYLMQVVHEVCFSIHVYLEPNLCIDHTSLHLFYYFYLCLLCRVPFFGEPSTYKKENLFLNKAIAGLFDMRELSQNIFRNLAAHDAEYSPRCLFLISILPRLPYIYFNMFIFTALI